VFYSGDEKTARIAGYFRRGEGDTARTFAYFYFDLARQPDGSWKIMGDSRTFEPKPYYQETISGSQLLSMLDSAGIRKAVVLSDAYWFDSPEYDWMGRTEAEEYAAVRAENDWTAEQAAASGGRLVAFCSFNPLAKHAITELERCKSTSKFAGVKLHLQMSGVDLLDPRHVAKLRNVFSNANRLRLPLIVHAQTKKNYGRESAQIFVDSILPAAPDIPVTIAHLWGGGPFNAEALTVYTDAVVNHRRGTSKLYFDLAEAALVANRDPARVSAIAAAIRQIGTDRILFGSDAVGQYTLAPVRAAAQFREDIPLTDAEFTAIAKNVLPYGRE
jgi:predicted TIM-barrel fold metal-dependent hydrolase